MKNLIMLDIKYYLKSKILYMTLLLFLCLILFSTYSSYKTSVLKHKFETLIYQYRLSDISELKLIKNLNVDLSKMPKNNFGKLRNTGTALVSNIKEKIFFNILSYHPDWIFNKIMLKIMRFGRMIMPFVGIYVISIMYHNQTYRIKYIYNKRRNIILSKLATIFFISLVFSIVILFVGSIAEYIINSFILTGSQEMEVIKVLYEKFDIWTPSLSYNMIAFVITVIYLTFYGFFGMFVAQILRNGIYSTVVTFIFFMNFYVYFVLKNKFSPFYHLHGFMGNLITDVGTRDILMLHLGNSLSFFIFLLIVFIMYEIMLLSIKQNYWI